MWKPYKVLYIILLVLFFALGFCVGGMVIAYIIYLPAYPPIGDWNGDGAVNLFDLFAMFDELAHGPKYPEFVVGPDVPTD